MDAGIIGPSPGLVHTIGRHRTARPAIVHYFDERDLAATIDEFVPWEGDVPLGTRVEVLVANRLLHPKALFRIGPWAPSAARTSNSPSSFTDRATTPSELSPQPNLLY